MHIEKIEIEKFRGIRQGLVGGLTPLSILVGPNNCGKSAVLEAVYLSWASWAAAAHVPAIVRRRGGPIRHAQESFMYTGTTPAAAQIRLSGTNGQWGNSTTLEIASVRNGGLVTEARSAGLVEPMAQYNLSHSHHDGGGAKRVSQQVMDDARGRSHNPLLLTSRMDRGFQVSFVDVDAVRAHGQLEECYSRLEKWNALEEVLAALRLSMEDLKDLRILQSDGEYILHLTHAKQKPTAAYLAGDGFKRFLALSAAILDGEDDVVLLEEPESYLHPRYVRELVTLLHNQVRKGKQVILCTHSHELIDALLTPQESEHSVSPSVHRLRLIDGVLRSVTVLAEDARVISQELFEDLRA